MWECFPKAETNVDQNEVRLGHVVKVVEFCGRQGVSSVVTKIAVAFALTSPITMTGIFRAATRLRFDAADEATVDSFRKCST